MSYHLLTPPAYTTLRTWSFCLRDTCGGLLFLRNQLTPPYANGVVAYAQVDMTRQLLNRHKEVLDAAHLTLVCFRVDPAGLALNTALMWIHNFETQP